jgi:hypothetical protein
VGGIPARALAADTTGAAVARDDVGTAAVLTAVLGWVVFFVVRDHWRSQNVRHHGDIDATFELPDDPAVVVDALVAGGTVRPTAIGHVILDLARRGHLEIMEDPGGPAGRDWRFRRLEGTREDLTTYENAVYTRLFSGGDVTTWSGFLAWAGVNRVQARVFFDRIRKYVLAELTQRGYAAPPTRVPVVVNLGVAGAVVLLALVALGSGAWAGMVALASGAGQVAASRTLRRGAVASPARVLEWSRVAEGLRTFESVDAVPATTPEEWDRYLVSAVALGVGEQFVARLRRGDGDPTGLGLGAWYRQDDGDRLMAAVRFPERLARSFDRVAGATAGRGAAVPAPSAPSAGTAPPGAAPGSGVGATSVPDPSPSNRFQAGE